MIKRLREISIFEFYITIKQAKNHQSIIKIFSIFKKINKAIYRFITKEKWHIEYTITITNFCFDM